MDFGWLQKPELRTDRHGAQRNVFFVSTRKVFAKRKSQRATQKYCTTRNDKNKVVKCKICAKSIKKQFCRRTLQDECLHEWDPPLTHRHALALIRLTQEMVVSGKPLTRPERLLRTRKKILQGIKLPTGSTRLTRKCCVRADFYIGVIKNATEQAEATAATTGATATEIILQAAAIAKAWATTTKGSGKPGKKGGKGGKGARANDHYG